MGYACPVCDDPQVDGRHLANHVAFTALTGDETHEAWLDEHVPGWGQLGEDELADEVVDHATETDVETVFDDGGTAPEVDRRPIPNADLDEDVAGVLEEAREYTRRMAETEGETDAVDPADDAVDPADASDPADDTSDAADDASADETE